MNTKTLLKLEENKKSILIGRIYVFVFLHILDTVIVYFIGLDYINSANQNASLTLWLPLFIFLFLSGLIRRDRISTITIIEKLYFFHYVSEIYAAYSYLFS